MSDSSEAPDFETRVPLPPVPGLRLRHFGGPDDYRGMNDAANASREADDDHFITDPEGFANFYENLEHCDRDRDLFIVEVDRKIVGYARTTWFDDADGTRIHELICFLDPAWRRRGIGSAMLVTIEARAREVATGLEPVVERYFQTDLEDKDPGAGAIVAAAGFIPVRHGYTMVRPTLDAQADAPMPDGLEIRQVKEEHLRAIFNASDEALRDEWGYRPATETDWQVFLTDPLSLDRDLWRVAWDGDQVAGQVRSFINVEENARFGQKRGWVENIAVRRPWRKRGLARALIASSIDALRERGMTEGALGVDTENQSGALRLYESVGFRPVSHSTTYRKPIPAG